jgi:hypothetical protein
MEVKAQHRTADIVGKRGGGPLALNEGLDYPEADDFHVSMWHVPVLGTSLVLVLPSYLLKLLIIRHNNSVNGERRCIGARLGSVACDHDAAQLRRVLLYVVVAAVPRYPALAGGAPSDSFYNLPASY